MVVDACAVVDNTVEVGSELTVEVIMAMHKLPDWEYPELQLHVFVPAPVLTQIWLHPPLFVLQLLKGVVVVVDVVVAMYNRISKMQK